MPVSFALARGMRTLAHSPSIKGVNDMSEEKQTRNPSEADAERSEHAQPPLKRRQNQSQNNEPVPPEHVKGKALLDTKDVGEAA